MKTRLALLLCVVGVSGYAQSPGTFTATGSMTTPRVSHAATLLLDGRVLIAGGEYDVSSLSSAEIYDPATGTFTPTGSMTRPRYTHSATLLPNGRVLIAGGFGPIESTKSGDCPLPSSCGYLMSAEIYDPSSGTFTVTGDMIALGGPAVLLPDGRVFLSAHVGSSAGAPPPHAQLYDPSNATFSATRAETPEEYLATLLPNGQVLLTGDFAGDGELYDPSTDTFSPTNNINYETATLLMNGKVLFISDPEDDLFHFNNEAQLYEPSTSTYAAAGSMTIARDQHRATLLPDGTVLIAGSELLGGGALANAEIYDPVLGTFGPTGSMITARYSHNATLLNNGQVLVTGGQFALFPATTSSAELYTPSRLVPAPVLFSLSGDGPGQGAIWHAATGQVASAANPAVAGEALSMYTTSLANGGVIPPQVAVGGRLAQVLYFGAAPGYPGYNQVNFLVPGGVPPGPAVPVRLAYIGRSSNAVTVGVQ